MNIGIALMSVFVFAMNGPGVPGDFKHPGCSVNWYSTRNCYQARGEQPVCAEIEHGVTWSCRNYSLSWLKFDSDADLDVDLRDWGNFQNTYDPAAVWDDRVAEIFDRRGFGKAIEIE